MLDSKDLEILQTMMQGVVSSSEARMTARIEESEVRMTAKLEERIQESEARMTARIEERVEDTRSMIMAYLESAIEPQIRRVAEGCAALQESKADNSRVDKLEEEVTTSRSLIMLLGDDVAKLKKAQ